MFLRKSSPNAAHGMAKLILTSAARADMVEIDEWGYQQFGEEVADNYSRKLHDAFGQLSGHPLSGKAVPEYGKAYRCLVHQKHRIFYAVKDDAVRIVRILHHAMDAKRVLAAR
jgi:toxin ParE1/3/4